MYVVMVMVVTVACYFSHLLRQRHWCGHATLSVSVSELCLAATAASTLTVVRSAVLFHSHAQTLSTLP